MSAKFAWDSDNWAAKFIADYRKGKGGRSMTIEIHLNRAKDPEGRSLGFFGYEAGHPMEHVYSLPVSDGLEDLAACEVAFRVFNIEHPADYQQRSLSVGDVVIVRGNAYACCSFGFEPVAAPLTVSGNPQK